LIRSLGWDGWSPWFFTVRVEHWLPPTDAPDGDEQWPCFILIDNYKLRPAESYLVRLFIPFSEVPQRAVPLNASSLIWIKLLAALLALSALRHSGRPKEPGTAGRAA
jgi:hypothetical protein